MEGNERERELHGEGLWSKGWKGISARSRLDRGERRWVSEGRDRD